MYKAKEKILWFAVLSRVIVLLLQMIFNFICPDHDADAFRLPVDSTDKPSFLDHIVTFILGGLTRWDAQYYIHIARYGYTYENTLAFFPLFPLAMRHAAIFLHIEPPILIFNNTLVVFGFVINFLCFIKASLIMFDLSEVVFKNPRVAYRAAILFCINPASIFFSAIYSESMFAYLTFYSMLESVRNNPCVFIPISLSTLVRSNGLVNVGFPIFIWFRNLLVVSIPNYVSENKHYHSNKRSLVFNSRHLLISFAQIICLVILALLPFFLLQVYSYTRFCKIEYNVTALPYHVQQYARENNLVLPGQASYPWIIAHICWTILGHVETLPTKRHGDVSNPHNPTKFEFEGNGDRLLTELVNDSDVNEEHPDSYDDINYGGRPGQDQDRSYEEQDLTGEPNFNYYDSFPNNLERGTRLKRDFSRDSDSPPLHLSLNVTSGLDANPESDIIQVSLGGSSSRDTGVDASLISDNTGETGIIDDETRTQDQSLIHTHEGTVSGLDESIQVKRGGGVMRSLQNGKTYDALNLILDLLRGKGDLLVQGNFSINVRDATQGKPLISLDGKFSSGLKGAPLDKVQKPTKDEEQTARPSHKSTAPTNPSTIKPTTTTRIVSHTDSPLGQMNYTKMSTDKFLTPVYVTSSTESLGKITNEVYNNILTSSTTEYPASVKENGSTSITMAITESQETSTALTNSSEHLQGSKTEATTVEVGVTSASPSVENNTPEALSETVDHDNQSSTLIHEMENLTRAPEYALYTSGVTINPEIEDSQPTIVPHTGMTSLTENPGSAGSDVTGVIDDQRNQTEDSGYTQNFVTGITTVSTIQGNDLPREHQTTKGTAEIFSQTGNPVSEITTVSTTEGKHVSQNLSLEESQTTITGLTQSPLDEITSTSSISDHHVTQDQHAMDDQTDTSPQTGTPAGGTTAVVIQKDKSTPPDGEPIEIQTESSGQIQNSVTEISTISAAPDDYVTRDNPLVEKETETSIRTESFATETATVPETVSHQSAIKHTHPGQTQNPSNVATSMSPVSDHHVTQDQHPVDDRTNTSSRTETPAGGSTTVVIPKDEFTSPDGEQIGVQTESSGQVQNSVTEISTISAAPDDYVTRDNPLVEKETETSIRTESFATETATVPETVSHQSAIKHTHPGQTQNPSNVATSMSPVSDHHVTQDQHPVDDRTDTSSRTETPAGGSTTVVIPKDEFTSPDGEQIGVQTESSGQVQNPVTGFSTISEGPDNYVTQADPLVENETETLIQTQNSATETATEPETQSHQSAIKHTHPGQTQNPSDVATSMSSVSDHHVTQDKHPIDDPTDSSFQTETPIGGSTTVAIPKDESTSPDGEQIGIQTESSGQIQNSVTEISTVSAAPDNYVTRGDPSVENETETSIQTQSSATETATEPETQSHQLAIKHTHPGQTQNPSDVATPMSSVSDHHVAQDKHPIDDQTDSSFQTETPVRVSTTVVIPKDESTSPDGEQIGIQTESSGQIQNSVTEISTVSAAPDNYVTRGDPSVENETETSIQTQSSTMKTAMLLETQSHPPATKHTHTGSTHNPETEVTTVSAFPDHRALVSEKSAKVTEITATTTVLDNEASQSGRSESGRMDIPFRTQKPEWEVTTISTIDNNNAPQGSLSAGGEITTTARVQDPIRDTPSLSPVHTESPDHMQDPVTEISFVSAVHVHHVPLSILSHKGRQEDQGRNPSSVTETVTESAILNHTVPEIIELGTPSTIASLIGDVTNGTQHPPIDGLGDNTGITSTNISTPAEAEVMDNKTKEDHANDHLASAGYPETTTLNGIQKSVTVTEPDSNVSDTHNASSDYSSISPLMTSTGSNVEVGNSHDGSSRENERKSHQGNNSNETGQVSSDTSIGNNVGVTKGITLTTTFAGGIHNNSPISLSESNTITIPESSQTVSPNHESYAGLSTSEMAPSSFSPENLMNAASSHRTTQKAMIDKESTKVMNEGVDASQTSTTKATSPSSMNKIPMITKRPNTTKPTTPRPIAGKSLSTSRTKPPKTTTNKNTGTSTKKPSGVPTHNKPKADPVKVGSPPKNPATSSKLTKMQNTKNSTSPTLSRNKSGNNARSPSAVPPNKISIVKPTQGIGKTKPVSTKNNSLGKPGKISNPTKRPVTKKPSSSRPTPKVPHRIFMNAEPGAAQIEKNTPSTMKKQENTTPTAQNESPHGVGEEQAEVEQVIPELPKLSAQGIENSKGRIPVTPTDDSQFNIIEEGSPPNPSPGTALLNDLPMSPFPEVENDLVHQDDGMISNGGTPGEPNVAVEVPNEQLMWPENPGVSPDQFDAKLSPNNPEFNPQILPPSGYHDYTLNDNHVVTPNPDLGHFPQSSHQIGDVISPNSEAQNPYEHSQGIGIPNASTQNIFPIGVENSVDALQSDTSDKILNNVVNFPHIVPSSDPLENIAKLSQGSKFGQSFGNFLNKYQSFLNRAQANPYDNSPNNQNTASVSDQGLEQQNFPGLIQGSFPSLKLGEGLAVGRDTIPSAQQFFETFQRELNG
ncbi:hypothetical protein QAD02_000375 [Eretmocerus hayati]|uniref:Uncharacterized protein n=1 Tax=Eretmocerus hayati TaxID=131215 RepID=A0ACC2NER9_9HYME|nr:hypothetical protein QAD02_000375 [Eretmocerus hayati]